MKFQVTEIAITFDKGSFEEWTNAHEEQSAEDIEQWKKAYHAEIKAEIKDVYPNANVTVDEGYDQTGRTQYYVNLVETETNEDYQGEEWENLKFEDQVKLEIDRILDVVSNRGKFWEA